MKKITLILLVLILSSFVIGCATNPNLNYKTFDSKALGYEEPDVGWN